MNGVWWGKETSPELQQEEATVNGAPSSWPQLVTSDRNGIYADILARASSYTPEWISRRPADAGIALAHLFGEEMEPVLQRLNQLPANCFIRFLKSAGVQPRPASPAQALLQFSVSSSAPGPIPIAAGFQVAGGDTVIFETNTSLVALPGKIQEIYSLERGLYRSIDPTQTAPFQPFGANPAPGIALFIGITPSASALPPAQISFGIQAQGPQGPPPPVSTGGVAPLPAPLSPLLEWSVLDGPEYRTAEVALDETGALAQGGVVTLNLPSSWRPGIPQGAPDTSPLLWVRVRILYGSYAETPVLLSIVLNAVRATALQSYYNEVLTPVSSQDGGGAVMSLSHTPVIPDSLILQVDDSADLVFSTGTAVSAPVDSIWTQVDDLSQSKPDDRVYLLDPATGLVSFGDGQHGMALPPGFRNVTALKYQVGGGEAGAVDAGKISSPVNSVPFLSGVQNPFPATGGMDPETQDQALLRGPQEIRAGGRAVAAADYEVLALRATGAQVARAEAVGGFHPAFPGTPIPGVVCVFVIPIQRGTGPPVPDEDTLRAVSSYLSSKLALAGVEIVAAAPVYHTVRVQASVVVDPAVSRGVAVQSVIDAINAYLDPVTGGDDGRGWPFGGALSNSAMVRRIFSNAVGITAVPSLIFVVDGIRGKYCADASIPANSLVWPENHQVLGLGPGEEP